MQPVFLSKEIDEASSRIKQLKKKESLFYSE